METETIQTPPKRRQLVYAPRGARTAPPQRVDIGRGVFLTLRPLNTLAHAMILSRAAKECTALADGRATERDWGLTPEEIAAVKSEPNARAAIVGWMRSVLLAEASATAIEGLFAESGEPCAPDFDTFAWLFSDAQFEASFNLVSGVTERLYVPEPVEDLEPAKAPAAEAGPL